MKSLASNFLKSAISYPGNNALYVDGTYLTYKGLLHYAQRIALFLTRNLNSDATPQCALFTSRSQTSYASVLGAIFAGMAYVPLNPQFPDERNVRVIELSEASALIVDGKNVDKVASLVANIKNPITIIFPDLSALPTWTHTFPLHRYVLGTQHQAHESLPIAPLLFSPNAYILLLPVQPGFRKG